MSGDRVDVGKILRNKNKPVGAGLHKPFHICGCINKQDGELPY